MRYSSSIKLLEQLNGLSYCLTEITNCITLPWLCIRSFRLNTIHVPVLQSVTSVN